MNAGTATPRSASADSRRSVLMEFLIDVLVMLGVAAAVGIGALYVYFADRMVSGR